MPKLQKTKQKLQKNIKQSISTDVLAQFHEAAQLHREGQLDQALSLYQAVLAKYPKQVDALHFSGVIAFQQNRPAEAIQLIQKAIDLKPNFAAAACTMAVLSLGAIP